MAVGDFTLFEEWLVDDGEGLIHDYEAHVFRLAIINNGVTPTAADATPRWSVSSGVDYDGNQVVTTGGYPDGGLTPAAPSWDQTGAVGKFDAGDVSLPQDAGGFTDGYWGILYNDSAANKNAIGFLDLGGPISEVAGPITIAWNAAGIMTKTIT